MLMNDEPLLKAFSRYLEDIGYSPGTQQYMQYSVKELLIRAKTKGITHLQQLQPEHIQQHYQYLSERPHQRKPGGLSAITITTILYCLRVFFNWLQQTGQIKTHPMSLLNFEKPESSPREILTEEEVKELYSQTENLRDKAILALFYGCGLRRSEAEKINTTDIHFKSQLLYVREGKGKKRRVIPMSNKVSEDLKNYYHHERKKYIREKDKSSQEAFILNDIGRRMTGQYYRLRIKYLLSKAGIPKNISLHHLRHSIATHLLARGLQIEYVRDFLGHQELESTQIYTRVSSDQLQAL
ncbi:MAG: hypothetical protein EOP48_21505 [Sphingobacteriales bacterium]|nr:MAG: hypothetical protein EOP48_21505 [Sphingobacteriales bacterium]